VQSTGDYQRHLQHLKLKGLQPKTIDAYARAIRRIGERFGGSINDLSPQQLTDYLRSCWHRTHGAPSSSTCMASSSTTRMCCASHGRSRV
jgi:hypothetical protein